ncbi:hypothetical protein V6N11_043384 [Hibiscus sabdariffa]|uniref:Uncharacterized protein n=1 Tax=Hibiscus sabdariffa TaxID=183260 RepID=A0ABR1ZA51_9ROSI
MRKVTGKRKETDENEEIKAAFNVTLKKETVPEFSYSATVTRGHEAIVPCDLNLITDMDLRYLIQKPDEKVSFAILSDSCHSGGLINKDKEQIGPSRVRSRAPPPQVHFKSRGILVGTICFVPQHEQRVLLSSERPLTKDEGILLSASQVDEISSDLKGVRLCLNPSDGENEALMSFAISSRIGFGLIHHLQTYQYVNSRASPKDCSFKDCSALLMDDGGVDFSFATVVDCNGIKLIGAVKT